MCAWGCLGSQCGQYCQNELCAMDCVGQFCGSYCTGHMCAQSCGSGAAGMAGCGTRCKGVECAQHCKGTGCGAHCVGGNCANECFGDGCGFNARSSADEAFPYSNCDGYYLESHCTELSLEANLMCEWTNNVCRTAPTADPTGAPTPGPTKSPTLGPTRSLSNFYCNYIMSHPPSSLYVSAPPSLSLLVYGATGL